MNCLRCGCEGLHKSGFAKGKQRYKCKGCGYQMTRFSERGRSQKEKALALILYVSGLSMNRIGKIIGVTAQTVMRWMRAFAEKFKESMNPEPSNSSIRTLEVDEMWHYIKKNSTVYGYGKYMIVPLSDVLPGSWVIVPVKPFKG